MSAHMLSYIKMLQLLSIMKVNKQAVWTVGLQLQEMTKYSALHLFSYGATVATQAAKWTHRRTDRQRK